MYAPGVGTERVRRLEHLLGQVGGTGDPVHAQVGADIAAAGECAGITEVGGVAVAVHFEGERAAERGGQLLERHGLTEPGGATDVAAAQSVVLHLPTGRAGTAARSTLRSSATWMVAAELPRWRRRCTH
jgi:hypothetical protein